MRQGRIGKKKPFFLLCQSKFGIFVNCYVGQLCFNVNVHKKIGYKPTGNKIYNNGTTGWNHPILIFFYSCWLVWEGE